MLMPMARPWRSIAAAVGLLLAGGVAGCGGHGGTASTVRPATRTVTVPAARGGFQVGRECSRSSVGFTPLSDLGRGTYKGVQGGLYPHGQNVPPTSYLDAGRAAARQVRPLAPNGTPNPSGRVVLLSIGMSNASRAFTGFIHLAAHDHTLTPGLISRPAPGSGGQGLLRRIHASEASLALDQQHAVLVNGAFPTFDAESMIRNSATYHRIVDTDLADAGVTSKQVQAVWLYEAIANEHEPFPTDAKHLERDLDALIAMLTRDFPNLRLVYLSSREYGGYAVHSINPEPYAYESGFAVKWTVAARMADPGTRPWVAWGPYTWADGTRARADGLTWSCADFAPDGTHPSLQGVEKLGRMLLDFFTTDPTTRTWFNAASR